MAATPTTPVPSHLIAPSPANGAVLTGNTLSLAWSPGTGVVANAIWIGSNDGSYELWAKPESGSSDTFTVPTDGRIIHVRLWSYFNGNWHHLAYRFTTQNTAAVMTSPASDNTVLSGASQTFTWTPPNNTTVTGIWIGTRPYSYDLHARNETGNTSDTFNNLPTVGGPIYVTLWTFMNGEWISNLYYYIGAGGN